MARARASYVPRALHLVWESTGRTTLVWLVGLTIQGLIPAAQVYLTKWLVDAMAAAVGGGLERESVAAVLLPAGLMVGLIVLSEVVKAGQRWIAVAQAERVQDHVKALVHQKASSVDLEFYDSSEYFDRMSRANQEASARSLSLLQNVGALLQQTVTLLGIAAVLLPYGAWLPIVLLVSTAPALWVAIRHNQIQHDWWERTTELKRWAQYFDMVLTYRHTAPEVRMLGIADRFQQSYASLRSRLRSERLALVRSQAVQGLAAAAAGFVATGGVLGWMTWRALRGAATLGDIALFYQAFNQGQGVMRTLLGSVGSIYADTLFLQHLFEFLELEPRVLNPQDGRPCPRYMHQGVEVSNVDFRYPGTDTLALQDFSLSIPAGQTVAVVGPNGAGKSTLIKLLCRFYDPDKGAVLWDGGDIRDYDVAELRRRITVMFQYPVHYRATAAENIAFGDVHVAADEAEVRDAAKKGGADEFIERLPRQYDTLLGRSFADGAELSGGQWQRIALSRSFFRDAALVVLDEPTSHMDSWAEAEWLDRFRELVRDRAALIVTHRFTTAMRADLIYVMDGGRVIESGTHQELVELGGRYASSWRSQMSDAEQIL